MLKGNVASGAVRRAVVQGTSYGWNDNTVGLLWQTHKDSRSTQGWSSSVLCLEQPGQGVKPVLFQDYQEIFYRWPVGEAPTPGETPTDSVKGGFFLPEEVQNAQIILGDSEKSRKTVR